MVMLWDGAIPAQDQVAHKVRDDRADLRVGEPLADAPVSSRATSATAFAMPYGKEAPAKTFPPLLVPINWST